MSKILNRFDKENVITVHDELLSSLYALHPSNIYYKVINGEQYLINSIKGKNYEIGLRVKLKDNSIPVCVPQETPLDYNSLSKSWEDTYVKMTLNIHYTKLCFTNIEKYVMNILLDKFLNNHQKFDMTFLEMEKYYRGKVKPRATSLSEKIAMKYATALDSLAEKELFLITSPSFRKYKNNDYGVSGLNIIQPLLSITNSNAFSKNNIIFSYSFGGFGRVIKLSRRYSTILPITAYRININQLRLHLAGFYLAQDVFIQTGLLARHPTLVKYQSFVVDVSELIEATTEASLEDKPLKNPLRFRREMSAYVSCLLPYIDGVMDVEKEYIYNETERFMQKHEADYDIQTDLDNYEFTLKDLDQDVELRFTAHMDYPDI